jgi:hypothetical protein
MLRGRFAEPAAFDAKHTGDDVKRNPAAGKGAGDFRHATGATVCEPLAGGGSVIVEGAGGLQIEDQNGCVRSLHSREDLAAGGVGCDITHNQFHLLACEGLAGARGTFLAVDNAGIDDIAAQIKPLSDDFLVTLKSLF